MSGVELRPPPEWDQLGLQTVYPKPPTSQAGDEKACCVDIVAVHGIAAHPYQTWQKVTSNMRPGDTKDLETKINWLDHEQMLPKICPRARIMTFGYDSQWFGHEVTRQDLTSVANTLLLSLIDERRKCQKRPLIFVGHCYGGLVIQKALVIAKHRSKKWPEVFESAVGIVFLGTPHRGTGQMTSVGIRDTLADRLSQNPTEANPLELDDSVLEILKSESAMLNDLREEFVEIWTATHGKEGLVCFYEQKATSIGRILGNRMKEYVVTKESATIDGFDSFALGLDHFDLNKYHGPKDHHFRMVATKILDFLNSSHAYKEALDGALQDSTGVVDSSTLEELIELRAYVNSLEIHGCPPLYHAAKNGDTKAVRILLGAGAKVDAGANGNHTPLHAAAENGHPAVVDILITNDADVEAKTELDLETPLPPSGKSPYEYTKPSYYTPLHAAASLGHLEVVRVLLAAPSININSRTSRRWGTPLYYAATNGYADVVCILINVGADVEAGDQSYTPLNMAVSNGHSHVTRTLLDLGGAAIERRNRHNLTALHRASQIGEADTLKILLEAGAHTEAKDSFGLTPLHLRGNAAVARVLIDFGANRNAQDDQGRTPFDHAKEFGRKDAMQVLKHYSK